MNCLYIDLHYLKINKTLSRFLLVGISSQLFEAYKIIINENCVKVVA